jgi:hypothetical protein
MTDHKWMAKYHPLMIYYGIGFTTFCFTNPTIAVEKKNTYMYCP